MTFVYQIKSYADGHPVNITLTRAKKGDGCYKDAKVWTLDSGLLNKTSLIISSAENCQRGAVVTFLERMYNK